MQGEWIGIGLMGASSLPSLSRIVQNMRENAAIIKQRTDSALCSFCSQLVPQQVTSLRRRLSNRFHTAFLYPSLLFTPTLSACNILHLLLPWQPALLSIILRRFTPHHQRQAPREAKICCLRSPSKWKRTLLFTGVSSNLFAFLLI